MTFLDDLSSKTSIKEFIRENDILEDEKELNLSSTRDLDEYLADCENRLSKRAGNLKVALFDQKTSTSTTNPPFYYESVVIDFSSLRLTETLRDKILACCENLQGCSSLELYFFDAYVPNTFFRALLTSLTKNFDFGLLESFQVDFRENADIGAEGFLDLVDFVGNLKNLGKLKIDFSMCELVNRMETSSELFSFKKRVLEGIKEGVLVPKKLKFLKVDFEDSKVSSSVVDVFCVLVLNLPALETLVLSVSRVKNFIQPLPAFVKKLAISETSAFKNLEIDVIDSGLTVSKLKELLKSFKNVMKRLERFKLILSENQNLSDSVIAQSLGSSLAEYKFAKNRQIVTRQTEVGHKLSSELMGSSRHGMGLFGLSSGGLGLGGQAGGLQSMMGMMMGGGGRGGQMELGAGSGAGFDLSEDDIDQKLKALEEEFSSLSRKHFGDGDK